MGFNLVFAESAIETRARACTTYFCTCVYVMLSRRRALLATLLPSLSVLLLLLVNPEGVVAHHLTLINVVSAALCLLTLMSPEEVNLSELTPLLL